MSAPSPMALSRDGEGRLIVVLADGTRLVGVIPARAFPLTAPTEWISLLDEHGKELAMLRTLDDLGEDARVLLEEALVRREFMPIVLRIMSVVPESHPTVWRVDTDRGLRELLVPSEDNIHALPPDGAILSDADGVRYRVLDRRKLDKRSRELLARHL